MKGRTLHLIETSLFLVLVLVTGACSSTKQQAKVAAPGDTISTVRSVPAVIPTTVPLVTRAPKQAASADTALAGEFDNGRMWTFDNPPVEYLRRTYNFTPDARWFERAHLNALRIPGCTASFVSPNGLVMTNHHCARGSIAQVTRPGEQLLDNGFYAETLDQERPIPGMYADQLIRIEDVTDEIYQSMESGQTDAERVQARQDAIAGVTDRLSREAGGVEQGINVQVISLYNGGQYSAYIFRRYNDVRLVMAPEFHMAHFGGESDNFTYPRYSLDMSFLRVYENDKPLQTEHFFPWSPNGASPGELVFVIGNPGSTNRLETVSQLEFRRDVQEKNLLALLESRVSVLEDIYRREPSDRLRTQILSLQNGLKLYRGRVKGLNDEVLLARRRDAERRFIQSIHNNPDFRREYGTLISQLDSLQQAKRELASEYGAFLALSPAGNFDSATLRRAMVAAMYLAQQPSGAAADPFIQQMNAVTLQPASAEASFLAARLRDIQAHLGPDSDIVQSILKGRSPEEAASQIVATSVLADSARAVAALRSGSVDPNDPAVAVARAIMPRYQEYQSGMAGLGAAQDRLGSQLGRARFAVYGTAVPPDPTFSLRLADGVVQGYPYNGTVAPPHTTFYGVYDHYYSYGPGSEWDVPQRWLTPPEEFDLSTPMNLVATADIIGGNSGSPMVNRDLQVVGLVFDGNIESLPSSFIYRPENFRAVAVDSRGILESIDDLYGADRLAIELKTGRLVPTEQEADTASR